MHGAVPCHQKHSFQVTKMANETSASVRGAGLLKAFFAATGASSIPEDGSNLIDWLEQKFQGSALSEDTARSYRNWICAYLDQVGDRKSVV